MLTLFCLILIGGILLVLAAFGAFAVLLGFIPLSFAMIVLSVVGIVSFILATVLHIANESDSRQFVGPTHAARRSISCVSSESDDAA